MFWKMGAVALAMGLAGATSPVEATEYWAVVNTLSAHSEHDCPACEGGKPNQANWGLGLEARFSEDWGAQVGAYHNTFGKVTTYGIGIYQPFVYGHLKAGLFGGLATGYKSDPGCMHSVCPVGGMLLTVENGRFGFNVMAIPKVSAATQNVFGLQLKVKLN